VKLLTLAPDRAAVNSNAAARVAIDFLDGAQRPFYFRRWFNGNIYFLRPSRLT
jgi:hypothetical protein